VTVFFLSRAGHPSYPYLHSSHSPLTPPLLIPSPSFFSLLFSHLLPIPPNFIPLLSQPFPNHPSPNSSFSQLVSLPTHLGLGTEIHSEKIPRNRLGTVSVIPRKKVLIPRHSEFRRRANSEAEGN
jgi:hypothetical protein